jgi:uncharacterized phage protein gp47/JayE
MPLDTNYSTPTLSTLIDRIESDFETRLPGEGAKIKRTFLYVASRVLAGSIYGVYGFSKWLSRQLIYDTIDDIDTLERVGAVWGITRIEATKATGSFGFTGTPSTAIAAGTVVARANGVEYVTDALLTLDAGGAGSVAATASVAGASGNIADGAEILEISNAIAGVNSSVAVSVMFTGGSDQETFDNLKERLLSRIRETPQGGAAADYVAWATETEGTTQPVDRVWVFGPPNAAAGEVIVMFVLEGTGSAIFPGSADVLLVTNNIDAFDSFTGLSTRRPVTADLSCGSPGQQATTLSISISPNDATTQEAVESEIEAMFVRESEPGGTIKNSKLHEAISRATGLDFYALTDVNGLGASSDIIAGAWDTLTYVGAITWSAA